MSEPAEKDIKTVTITLFLLSKSDDNSVARKAASRLLQVRNGGAEMEEARDRRWQQALQGEGSVTFKAQQ